MTRVYTVAPEHCSVGLPRRVMAQLLAFCAAHGEDVGAVVADAVSLHLDALEEISDRTAAVDADAALASAPASSGAPPPSEPAPAPP